MNSLLHRAYFQVFPQAAVITPRGHGIDISKYDLYFKPETATGQLDFVVQRVSYGYTRDEAFEALLPGVLQVGVRGGYHYLSSGLAWQVQADKFIAYAGDHHHFYVCDFEGSFNVLSTAFAKMAWEWIRYVAGRTGKPVLLYTSLSLYNAYIYPSQRIYGMDWNVIPYWQAQWHLIPNPNGTPTMPTGRTAGWRLWQYTDKGNGPMYGVARPTACDLNVYNGTLAEMKTWLGIGDTPPPPAEVDEIRMIFDGVKSITGTRYGCKFYLKVSDPAKVRFEVAHLSTGDRRELPSNIARLYEAQMAWNGADWNKLVSPAVPLGPAVSGGVTYIPRSEADPSLIFFEDGRVVIDHRNLAEQYEVTTGVRYLVVAGEVASYLYGSEPQYTERHARSVEGIDGNGHVMRLTVDGEWPDNGMLLRECAELMRSFGAVKAFDTGGGGDSVEVINGEVTSIPADRDDDGNPAERRVPQFLLAYVKEPSMTNYYEYTALGNRAIRTGPGATYGRIASGSDFLTNTKAKGGATAADRVTLTAETAPPVQGMAGDVWVKVYDNNGRAVDGWTAYIHRGVVQITQVLIGGTPPPVAQFAVLDITVTDPNTGKKYGGTGIQLPEVP